MAKTGNQTGHYKLQYKLWSSQSLGAKIQHIKNHFRWNRMEVNTIYSIYSILSKRRAITIEISSLI